MADSGFFGSNPIPTQISSLQALVNQATAAANSAIAAAAAQVALANAAATNAANSATNAGAILSGASLKQNNLSDLYDIADALTNLGAAASGVNSDITALNALTTINGGGLPIRGYLAGCQMAYVSGTSISVAPGSAATSDNSLIMTLGSTITKTTGAWVVGNGNGMLDTGSLPSGVATWFHIFLILKPSTGTVDVLMSLSATNPTMPAGYTKKRRIGSINWLSTNAVESFSQNGDEFLFSTPHTDLSALSITTTASTAVISTPSGVKANCLSFLMASNTAATITRVLASSLDANDMAPSVALTSILTGYVSGSGYGSAVSIRANTSSSIRLRTDQASGVTVWLTTFGYIDTRGRFA